MTNPTKLISELMEMSSNTEKEAFIKKHSDNDYFLQLLFYNLDPYTQFYIKKIPDYEIAIEKFWDFRRSYISFNQLAQDLSSRKITGNAAKQEVVRVFSNMAPEDEGIYSIILRKAAVGVGVTTFNKGLKGTSAEKFFKVTDFKVLLAPNDVPNLSAIKYPVLASPKMDGFRAIYWPQRGASKFLTRAGKVYENPKLLEHFKALEGMYKYVLDGELYIHNENFNNIASTLTTEDAEIPKGLKYVVFDCIPIKDWDKQKCTIPYEERLKILREVLNDQVADYKRIIDVATDKCNNAKEVKDLYKKYLNNNYEGLMLRNPDAEYQWKRPTLKANIIMKVKPIETYDGKIIGFYEGEESFVGTLGGVTVDFNGVKVDVGTGFTIDERKEVWNNRDKYLGTYIEIKYMEVTEDNSMRHPVFIRFRKDKK